MLHPHTSTAPTVPSVLTPSSRVSLASAPAFALPRVRHLAAQPLSLAQKSFLVGTLLALPLFVYQHWIYALLFILVALATILYFALLLLKGHLAWKSLSDANLIVTPSEVAALSTQDLPLFTLLVPLYHEGSLLPTLIDHLRLLHYPPSSLQILLLLEADDQETHKALATVVLPSHFQVLDIPLSNLRTKPKACNVGLIYAQGEFCGIYDAEDFPEPDQLLKVVAGFAKSPPTVACLQAALAFTNQQQNFLTRFFAAEYAMYFHLVLPGLSSLALPTPLGGTSNFFRTAWLRELGGWDPYNVTEDLDLGICVARAQQQVVTINSQTHEVATWLLARWLRQRTRWVKGYIQTYFVHMRHPLQLWRDLGPAGFFGFQLLVGGTPLVLLLNPIFWLLTLMYVLTGSTFITSLYPGALYWLGLTSLVAGNFIFMWLFMAACVHQGLYRNVKWMFLAPLYWLLMSLAAFRAAYQFFSRPHYWEKTNHAGFSWPLASPSEALHSEAQS